jgi:hypothetical protein
MCINTSIGGLDTIKILLFIEMKLLCQDHLGTLQFIFDIYDNDLISIAVILTLNPHRLSRVAYVACDTEVLLHTFWCGDLPKEYRFLT